MMTNVPSHGYAGLYAREGLYASKPPDFAGVYAESRDSRITSHAEPGSLVRLRCTADKLLIKTLEFRDSEKSASGPPAGVYSPNAISHIHDTLPRESGSSPAGRQFRHKVPRPVHLVPISASRTTARIAVTVIGQQHHSLNFSRFRPLPPRC